MRQNFILGFAIGLLGALPLTHFCIKNITSKMDILYPTKTCFEDAMHYKGPGHIVRDTLTDPVGYSYDHAWIENNGQVISWGILHGKRAQFTMAANDYYQAFGRD